LRINSVGNWRPRAQLPVSRRRTAAPRFGVARRVREKGDPAMSLIARRNPSRSSVHVFPRLLALSAIVLSMCGALMTSPGRALADSAVTTSALNLRYGGSMDRGVILVRPSGASVEILGGPNSNNFYKVNYNGTNGYAYADYISTDGGGGSASGGGASGDATVDSALNLRSRPSTSASVLLVMPGGASVSLTGNQQNGFLELSYQGTGGWGYADYILSLIQI
jgi:uncharacterized protein YraI